MRVRATNNGTSRVQDVSRLSKRFSGARFTEYETGMGACGTTNSDNDFIVALNTAQYGSGQDCYKMISISYNGKTTQAQIVDECPGCPYGGLDLAPGLFSYFADISMGTIIGEWEFGDAPSSSATPTSSTPAWTPPPPPSTTHFF
ncbi:hypothetical protein EW145_g3750 [Phellinidium pouzarii]|uniref:RlpA-like protein double-psi beta-barrel domain-containing protein n=1 Tax=Phellinidium pouzarii TaxID=167371 RepID=A0A4V3XCR5_9AGAM|nr:hypothetical protein EW145_g3750 [Phellinidium pouzarii]